MSGKPEGFDRVRAGVELARNLGAARLVAHGLSQIGSGAGEIRAYDSAIPALRECVEYADKHELSSRGLYSLAWLGRCLVELGQWDEATGILTRVLRSPSGGRRHPADGADRAGPVAGPTRRPGPAGPAGRGARTGRAHRPAATVVAGRGSTRRGRLVGRGPRRRGRTRSTASCGWLAVSTSRGPPANWPSGLAGPVSHPSTQTRRRPLRRTRSCSLAEPAAAANQWRALGCRYEAADALSHSADDADQLEALAIWQVARRRTGRPADRPAPAGRRADRYPAGRTRQPRATSPASPGASWRCCSCSSKG